MAQDIGAAIARGLRAWDKIGEAAAELRSGGAVALTGCDAASRPAVVSALWIELGLQFFVWSANQERADRFANDCAFYTQDFGAPVYTLRPRDTAPNALANPTERADRMTTLDALASGKPGIYCISHAAACQPLADPDAFARSARELATATSYEWEDLLKTFDRLGYARAEVVGAAGEYAVRGGILDVFPATAELPVRLEFFGDRLEQIRSFAISTQRSLLELSEIRIAPWSEEGFGDRSAFVWQYAPSAVLAIDDPEAIVAADHARADADDRAATVAAADSPEPATQLGDSAPQRNDTPGTSSGTSFDAPDSAPQRNDTTARCSGASLDVPREAPSFRALADAIGERAVCALSPGSVAAYEGAGRAPGRSKDRPLQYERTIAIESAPAPAFGRSIERFTEYARASLAHGLTLAIASVSHRRIREVLDEHSIATSDVPKRFELPGRRGSIACADGTIDVGFAIPALRFAVIGDYELYGHPARRHRRRSAKEGVPASLEDLAVGEHFVHAHHGIGQYLGLEHIVVEEIGRDFMTLAYAGGDRLYVPVDQMHLVRKYASADGQPVRLSKLGGSDWVRTRSKVREAVERIADGLVRLYAARELAQGHAFAPDTPWQAELEESFPYDETPDQAEAIRVVKDDMERPRPMDRLVCGDVGYGKTEVAVRAAFKAIMDQRQVALLAPTTVLAAQHFRTFSERFAAYPAKIALLSRFRTKAEQKATLAGLSDGSIDLVIGTHRLLQRDVGFSRLGLVMVDEEQRFGVMHKERLKELRQSVDVLTLSATPIPRTLHMAMAGVRDLSLIQTPPQNRVAIKTVVAPNSDTLIESALELELDRGGQVYFVHNRVETIYAVAAAVQALAPRARIAVGHGQMHMHELEGVMLRFVNGEIDILVSTTIIENGLDIPNVNTIVVNNAAHFGLAQLYQLRGRVGRSAHQAYAYFLYQPHRTLSDVAQSRLEAIREFSHLGSGLALAMRDLEIRGAGNVLGREQSGFIAAVGFETYCEILQEAVAQRRGQPPAPDIPPPVLDIRVNAFIPASYMKAAAQKISFYQRLAAALAPDEVDRLTDELRDRFGPPPPEVLALLDLTRLRILAAAKGVQKVALEQRRLTLEVGPKFSLSEEALSALAEITGGNFRFAKDAIVAVLRDTEPKGRLASVCEIVSII